VRGKEGNWEIWVKRPVLWLLAFYAGGLILFYRLPIRLLYIWIAMAAVFITGFLINRRVLFPVLLILVFLFGGLRSTIFYQRGNPLKAFTGQSIILQGTVRSQPQTEPDRIILVLETNEITAGENHCPIKAKVKVIIYPNEYGGDFSENRIELRTGDFLQVSGMLKEPSGPRNPKGFDYKSYLARRNIYSTLTVKESDVRFLREGSSLSLNRILAGLRDKSAEIIETAVRGQEGQFLKAILLGQRWLIEPDVIDDFTKTGLAHILAISGLHIGFLVLLLSRLQSLFKLNRKAALLFQILILTAYALMTGASPSVTRAVIMALIHLFGKAMERRSDIINSAGVAAFLILLFRPMDIMEVSFQLSFLAVVSIGLFEEPVRKGMDFFPGKLIPKKIASIIAATLAAQAGVLPLAAYYFNLISPVSVLANLLVVPVLGIVTAGGFLLLPLGAVLPSLAAVMAVPLRSLCRLILHAAEFASNLPLAYFRVVSPSVVTIIFIFLILWVISRERPAFIRHPSLACMVLIIVFLSGRLILGLAAPRELKVVFLDVGQGDCCFIQTPDKKNILIDGGGQAGTNIGENVLLPFLLKNGISSLDLIIMSHNHEDHISGLIPVIKQLKAKAFMQYPPEADNPVYIELKNAVKGKGIPIVTAEAGQTFRIGENTVLHVLYPEPDAAQALYDNNENNLSLVLLLEYGNASILFTGDIEKGVEYYLAGRMEKDAYVLKVPHHGSNTSSTDVFLKAVSPRAAVIQCGINSFGHPAEQVLERLADHSITVYRNDLQGAVVMYYREGQTRWRVETMLGNNE
jgi:competence protein ComEC